MSESGKGGQARKEKVEQVNKRKRQVRLNKERRREIGDGNCLVRFARMIDLSQSCRRQKTREMVVVVESGKWKEKKRLLQVNLGRNTKRESY